ncbi:MAG TPA: DUF5666 domain-containing protein [Burkholderiales bacterium]|nr:DUF5666 domain-containing protein [Burkholderiales bacterium]
MKTTLALLLAVLSITIASAPVQAQTRVRGTITAASGDTLGVKTGDGRNVDVGVSEKTNIVFAQPIAASDIKSGDFLGVTSVKRKDGSLTAYDVRRFPKPTNPGHRPFDGRENQTMTNASVAATVQGASGRELVLSYEGGSQKVTVTDTAAVTSLVPGQRSQLTPGSYVNLLADAAADGTLVARNIEVRKDAPKPPQ